MKFYTDWEDFNERTKCNAWVATAIVGSAVIGAGAQIYGANKAAAAQRDASGRIIDSTERMYETTRADLAPYREIGQKAAAELEANDYYTAPIDVTAELANPNSIARRAYDFNLTQGNKAVANAAAARGLGVSGAALKGAANFTTGLVDNTYKTLFDMGRANKQDAYQNLKSLVDTGGNAAAQTGNQGNALTKIAADATTGAGNASAAAYNATGSAIKNFASDVGGYAAYKGLYGGGSNKGEFTIDPSGTPVWKAT